MSDETTTAPGIRDRITRGVFRRRVRAGLEAELKARAKKKGGPLAAADVPHVLAELTDADIDAATVQAMDATAEAPGAVGGPVLDWLKANPELVAKVVQLLIGLLLGG